MNIYYHPPERYATAEQPAREALPDITIPAEGTAPLSHPRLTLRFPGERQQPRPVVQMSTSDELRAASQAASRRPARCKNTLLHSGCNLHPAFSPAHMVHLQAPLLRFRHPPSPAVRSCLPRPGPSRAAGSGRAPRGVCRKGRARGCFGRACRNADASHWQARAQKSQLARRRRACWRSASLARSSASVSVKTIAGFHILGAYKML